MNNPRAIGGILIATVVLLGALGLWSGYRNGDIPLFAPTRVKDHEFPKALSDQTSTQNGSLQNTANTASTTKPMLDTKTNEKNPVVTMHTSQGDITLELYTDVMPITAGNFISLAQKGFYDNTTFHRVIDGFMIQGGDPNSKTDKVETYGTGGPGYVIDDEFVSNPKLSNVRGTIAMANSGPHSGGSQFFINLVDNTGLDFDKQPLTSKHPVFGKVIGGMDVVDKIGTVKTNNTTQNRPIEPVIVTSMTIGK